MAARARVAAQHDDWLNLTAPEPPWFALPAVTRAFPNGLDVVPPEVRAEHKALWDGDGTVPGARAPGSSAREAYLDWLLRSVLRWGDGYLTGDALPADLARGVTRHDVTVVPLGAYRPRAPAPVGFDDDSGVGVTAERMRVLVFALPAGTDPHTRPSGDTWPATWVQRAALACRHTGVALALVTDGDHLTLVHAAAGVATGTGTWRASEFAAEPILLDSFVSMLGSRRFTGVAVGDEPEALLAESVRSQADVTDTLGGQVRRAVELLVNAISRANLDRGGALLAGIEPHEVYQAAATGLMRLVFLLIAEENGLLPIDNSHYQSLYAVRLLREDLLSESFTNPEALETRSTAWHRLLATARAVHGGVYHDALRSPAYGGALFDPDRFPFLEGRTKDQRWTEHAGTPIPVTDLDVLAILDALIVLRPRRGNRLAGTQLLSYKQVDVEQVGHIYERLLDHDTILATEPILALRGRAGDEPEVPLSALEGKRIDGDSTLLDYLTDEKGKHQGCVVGTRKEASKLLAEPVPADVRANLRAACAGDETLARRIEPFANLLRLDLRDRPQVFLPGAYYVTETGSRRDTGTAYTTRDLADEVAEHALAPLCYSPGPQDTADTNAWRIRPSAEILALRVCDPAVGSGAILVAACRYLALRLVEAWGEEGDPRAATLATAADDPNRLDVLVEARRQVAEHCCYGVDRNPMAVEMAKLSMWLATVAVDRPFTFLDHAIKAGDSLLGIWDLDQLRWLHFDVPEGRRRAEQEAYALPGIDPVDAWKRLDPMVDRALELRAEMHSLGSLSVVDVERKAILHKRSERALTSLAAIADVLTGCAMSAAAATNPVTALSERLVADADVIAAVVEAAATPDEERAVSAAFDRAQLRLNKDNPAEAPRRKPLHWPLTFPEVFSRGAGRFNVMLGNPPFKRGKGIKASFGGAYRDYLVAHVADGRRASADLVAYFFCHALHLAKGLGFFAINSLSQADSRAIGLEPLVETNWRISRARTDLPWPGGGPNVCVVWALSAHWYSPCTLNEKSVASISPTLDIGGGWTVQVLSKNLNAAFQGVVMVGEGFMVPPAFAEAAMEMEPANADVLMPFLNGEDVYATPEASASRYAINFYDWPEEKARSYRIPFEHISQHVKPERQRTKADRAFVLRKPLPQRWWQYGDKRPGMHRAMENLDRVLVIPVSSRLLLPVFVSSRQILGHKLAVVTRDDNMTFGLLTSNAHFLWAWRQMKPGVSPTYSPRDHFGSFPFPFDSHSLLEAASRRLDTYRLSFMRDAGIGMRATYAKLSDPKHLSREVTDLRDLHVELDYAVLKSYGWDNLELGHGFHEVRGQGIRFTFEPEAADEVLSRLVELNREQYRAEVAAGLHKSQKQPKRSAAGTLFDDGSEDDE